MFLKWTAGHQCSKSFQRITGWSQMQRLWEQVVHCVLNAAGQDCSSKHWDPFISQPCTQSGQPSVQISKSKNAVIQKLESWRQDSQFVYKAYKHFIFEAPSNNHITCHKIWFVLVHMRINLRAELSPDKQPWEIWTSCRSCFGPTWMPYRVEINSRSLAMSKQVLLGSSRWWATSSSCLSDTRILFCWFQPCWQTLGGYIMVESDKQRSRLQGRSSKNKCDNAARLTARKQLYPAHVKSTTTKPNWEVLKKLHAHSYRESEPEHGYYNYN